MSRAFAITALFSLLIPVATYAPVPRPSITGLGFVRLVASDLSAADKFYGDELGLPRTSQCWGRSSDCFFVTPYQDVEVLRAALQTAPSSNLLESFGVWTSDASMLRSYLLARGREPGELTSQFKGEQHFEISDPEGHRLVFQSSIGSLPTLDSRTQVSHHMIHIGFVVQDAAKENRFYKDLLGFRLYWHGGFKDDDEDWYELQVADGHDWIEYMLNIPANADRKELGVQNHFSLGVDDVHATAEKLRKRGLTQFDGPEIGRDGKWALDAYDPDGTRVEIMEFRPAQDPCCHPYTASHPKL